MPAWTPKRGAQQLAEEFGVEQAIELLGAILRQEEIPDGLFLRVMSHVGNVHEATMAGPPGWRGWYEFPETWSARALGYLGPDAEPHLLGAIGHPHWRVRRTVVRSLGWIGGAASLEAVQSAASDPDPRVRAQSPISEVKIIERLARERSEA